MLRIGHALAPRGFALSAAVAALFAATACHYVDPQCLAADLGHSGNRAHGVELQLWMDLPYKRYAESLLLTVNGAGGVTYTELYSGDVTTCRRMSEDEKQGLARFWSSETLGMSMPRCGPGYAFHHYGRRACRESWPALLERSDGGLPYAAMVYDRPNEERIALSWDMESPLPEELELTFTGTLGLLCTENLRLARNLRRSMPELAARVGC